MKDPFLLKRHRRRTKAELHGNGDRRRGEVKWKKYISTFGRISKSFELISIPLEQKKDSFGRISNNEIEYNDFNEIFVL